MRLVDKEAGGKVTDSSINVSSDWVNRIDYIPHIYWVQMLVSERPNIATNVSSAGGWVVLAMVPNLRVGSGSCSDPDPDRCNVSYNTTTRTVAIGPGAPPMTRHFHIPSSAPNRYLSSDRTVTWSICKLCSVMRSFTSRFQICHLTYISWVAIKNPRF